MRSLFLRIFVSLAVAFIVVSLAVFIVAAGSGTIPLSTPVLARAVLFGEIQAMAENALSLYETAGSQTLSQYLDKLHRSSGTRVWLLDSDGHDVLGHPLPASMQRFCDRSFELGVPIVEVRRLKFNAAVRLVSNGKQFLVALN